MVGREILGTSDKNPWKGSLTPPGTLGHGTSPTGADEPHTLCEVGFTAETVTVALRDDRRAQAESLTI